MRWPRVCLVALTFLFGCLVACRKGSQERLVVAASITPLADLASTIAGPDAEVVGLVAPGEGVVDASGAPRTLDDGTRGRVKSARLLVLVGLGYDDALGAQVPLDAKGRTVRVADRVPTLALSGAGSASNPYVWLDPSRMRLGVKAIAEEMARTDGAHAAAYRKRAAELDERLAKLDAELDERLGTVPRRTLPVAGPELAYFAERYRLELSPPAAGVTPLVVRGPTATVDIFGKGAGGPLSYEALLRSLGAACEARLR